MRVIERACQLMKESPNEDPARAGRHRPADDPEVRQLLVQSSSVDLFGGEISSNAADYFAAGLKGRAHEKKYDDHICKEGEVPMEVFEDGKITTKAVPLRNAMNEILRTDYIDDNQRGVDRWNKAIAKHGIDFEIKLPNRRFNRRMGIYSGHHFNPEGEPISKEQFEAHRDTWLPTMEDKVYVKSLMHPVLEPGKMASWIAAPARGINGQPLDFQYVRRN